MSPPARRCSICGSFNSRRRRWRRGCVVLADLAVDLDRMADMSEPVAQAYLDALALCETESIATLWVHDRSVSFRHASDRSWNCDAHRLTLARRICLSRHPHDLEATAWTADGAVRGTTSPGRYARCPASCERRADFSRPGGGRASASTRPRWSSDTFKIV